MHCELVASLLGAQACHSQQAYLDSGPDKNQAAMRPHQGCDQDGACKTASQAA